MKVCVIGLGEVGLSTAIYVASKGFDVYGYDINEKAVARSKDRGIKASTNFNDFSSIDIYLICVSTSWNKNAPDLTSVFTACDLITRENNSLPLVSIESTVVPGTCRKIYYEIFKNRVFLIHVPHRYWAGDPMRHGVKQVRVIGAINKESLKRGISLYEDQLGIPLYVAPSIEIAEMSKISENAYRYVQIAFVEELKMICDELGLNFDDVRKACNTKWNINLLEAREGIGGKCLPKDIKYLSSLSTKSILLKSAMEVDRSYRKWLTMKQSAYRV